MGIGITIYITLLTDIAPSTAGYLFSIYLIQLFFAIHSLP